MAGVSTTPTPLGGGVDLTLKSTHYKRAPLLEERLSAVVRRGSSLSAEDLMISIYNTAADFCGDDFNDDVTILVVKCDFDSSPKFS
jgi:hypothetical protein